MEWVREKRGGASKAGVGSVKQGGGAERRSGEENVAERNGQYKKRGRCRNRKWAVQKAGALPQRELVSVKSGSTAARRSGQ